jgi:hypothetical protein
MENVGVLARTVNFGTARGNIGMPMCAINCGTAWKIIMCGCTR